MFRQIGSEVVRLFRQISLPLSCELYSPVPNKLDTRFDRLVRDGVNLCSCVKREFVVALWENNQSHIWILHRQKQTTVQFGREFSPDSKVK